VNIPARIRVSCYILDLAKENLQTMRPSKLSSAAVFATAFLFFAVFSYRPAYAQAPNDQNKSGQSSNDNISAGFNLDKNASAKDVGLPLYPGSRRHQDSSDDSTTLNMGLWGGSTGFKMAMLKMKSTDSPEKVAAYYRKALAKYGKVLTCGGPDSSPASNSQSSSAGSDAQDSKDTTKVSSNLDCGTDKPDKGGIELKAGTKEKQHIVGITPEGNLTTFQLVYIETRGLNNDK
jgi:hypothetical protein